MNWAAVKAFLGIVPSWCYWLLALVALCLGCEIHGADRVQKKWDLANQRQVDANEAALELRREQNRAQAAEQALASANIQKRYDDEMANVRDSLRNSERLRLGANWCDEASSAGPAEASGASGGNAADPAGRLLSPQLDEAIKELIGEMESVAATARAAQAFIRENSSAH
jgi:uncharacterized membrane protein YgcG